MKRYAKAKLNPTEKSLPRPSCDSARTALECASRSGAFGSRVYDACNQAAGDPGTGEAAATAMLGSVMISVFLTSTRLRG